MSPRSRRSLWLVSLWLLLCTAGCAALMLRAREPWAAALEAEFRAAQQVLGQQVARHDAVLATLASLQPSRAMLDAAGRGVVGSPVPQGARVWLRGPGEAWPPQAAERLAAAEAESARTGRAALAAPAEPGGMAWWVKSADPASYAIASDLQGWVQLAEWPWMPDGRTRGWLQAGGQRWPLVASASATAPSAWDGWFAQHRWRLPAHSPALELVMESSSGWLAWPWAEMAAWVMLSAVAVIAAEALAEQRARSRLAELRLRLGQAGQAGALDELACGVEQQLQPPLEAVLAGAQDSRRLLGEPAPDLAAARVAIDQAARQARQATELIGRLRRTVERPAWGDIVQAVRLDELLRDALELVEPECSGLGVIATLATEPAARAVQADPLALEQIVHNLLSNALHALAQVPAGERELEVSAAARGGHVVLTVRDTGPGIPEDLLPRLFEPFFSTRAGGLGLGLSLCDNLAGRMGGSLTGGNAAPRGAQFQLALPKA